MPDALLTIRGLSVQFATPNGSVTAVRNLDLDLQAGRTLAIVGESGSGKSTVAACINRLLAENGRITSGSILFEGRDLVAASEPEMQAIRGARIGLVPQDPMSNLNPLQHVGTQIREALEIHGRARGRAADRMVTDLLAMAGIPEPARRARQYPHELSGGMRQRVLIAIGLACRPRLLIADEPTSALDVTVQRVILDQIGSLTAEFGTAVLLITHDLALAAERADDVLVMYRGDAVEADTADAVLRAPKHDYSRRLLDAAPNLATQRLVDTGQTGVAETLVELVGVRKEYRPRPSLFGQRTPFVAVDGTSFAIARGRTVAIVGESGSGKSTTAKLLLKIEDVSAGTIRFDGHDITRLRGAALFAFRRRVQPVFQNPYGSLDERFTVRQSIEEPLLLHRVGDGVARRRRVDAVMDQVSLPLALADRLPRELSGGQRQRVAIARALALSPELIVLDEPVSALDVIVQSQILELLARLQRELGLAYLFISHDLAVVRMIAHEVHVMTGGRVVESGAPDAIFANPQMAYTRALLSAIPGTKQTGALCQIPVDAGASPGGRPLHSFIKG